MITKAQAVSARYGAEFHFNLKGGCSFEVGPRGGERLTIETWRASGACKTWVRSPERFRLPIKWGLRTSMAITDFVADMFHLPSECPAIAKREAYHAALKEADEIDIESLEAAAEMFDRLVADAVSDRTDNIDLLVASINRAS